MTDWQLVFGSQVSKPSDFDTTSSLNFVYQRRNVQRVSVEDEFSGTRECWQYDERKMSHGEYEKLLEDELLQTQLALTELYELMEG